MLVAMPAEPLPRSRRSAALAAAGVVGAGLLAACTKNKAAPAPTASGTPSRTGSPAPPADSEPPPTPTQPAIDAGTLADAIDRENTLLAAYDARASGMTDALAAALADFRAHHEAHLMRLQELPGALLREPTSEASRPATPRPSSTAAQVVTAIIEVEADAARSGAAACAKAGPTDFATLLAEIAGCEAQHAALLPGLAVVAP